LFGGGWFVTCIMCYYVVIYFINYFLKEQLLLSWVLSAIIVVVSFIFIERPQGYNMYDYTYFKWVFFFLFLLLGAIIGKSQKTITYHFSLDLLKLMSCILIYYAILIGSKKITGMEDVQIMSLIPLLGITFYFYKIAKSAPLKKLFYNKWGGIFIKVIGGLCLEIYLVQFVLFTGAWNHYFPLNLVGMFLVILACAYILRCTSRLFSQTFKEQSFNWPAVFSIY